MALTTVSSLSESFISGTPVVTDDVGLSQEKEDKSFLVEASGPSAILEAEAEA
jgi:hypothetical protein